MVFCFSSLCSPTSAHGETAIPMARPAVTKKTPVQGGVYITNPYLSVVSFSVIYFSGVDAAGIFKKSGGTLTLSRDDLTEIDLSVWVDMESVDTGIEERDNLLKDAFDVQDHPRTYFHSKELVFQNDGLSGVKGNLTIAGQTKEVYLEITSMQLNEKNVFARIKGKTYISRKDFGINFGFLMDMAVEDRVLLDFELVFVKKYS